MTNNPAPSTARDLDARVSMALVVVLLLMTAAMFADVIFTGQNIVVSKEGTDLYMQHIHWRQFGYNQLRQGNLPLWNPHIFAGAPYFATWQSALLYPPNLLFLIMPLAKAINAAVALHVFLLGLFMFLWARYRGMHPAAAFLAALAAMFGGPYFMHVYAGHLDSLSAMIWAPLIFMAIERFNDRPAIMAALLGAFAVAMQILSGHPQYVFFTAVAAGLFQLLLLIRGKDRVIRAAGFLGIYIGGAALSAAQLIAGLNATAESVRGPGLIREFAGMFSFPPENLLTLIAPGFFGDMTHFTYWGRCYLWEMSLFMGVTTLVCAIYGAWRGEPRGRRYAALMFGLLLLLALGQHTGLHRLLYEYVPGFNKFRGMSKFIFPASVFAALLAGAGLDALIRHQNKRFRLALITLGAAMIVGIVGLAVNINADAPDGWWSDIPLAIEQTRESRIKEEFCNPRFTAAAGAFAAKGLFLAAGTLLLLGIALAASAFQRQLIYAVIALAAAEALVFARFARPTFPLESAYTQQPAKLQRDDPGDYRVFTTNIPNEAMAVGAYEFWGYAPLFERRYAEFVYFALGQNPDKADQYLRVLNQAPLLKLARLRYIINGDNLIPFGEAMPHLLLLSDYHVATVTAAENAENHDKNMRNAVFQAMSRPGFDPARTVILESPPEPKPQAQREKLGGTVKLIEKTSDTLAIEADLPAPAILLVTDAYAQGWRARPLAGVTAAQKHYEVMPADYAFRAVPLAAGHHRLLLEYAPENVRVGFIVSALALLASLGLIVWNIFLTRRAAARKNSVGEKKSPPQPAGN